MSSTRGRPKASAKADEAKKIVKKKSCATKVFFIDRRLTADDREEVDIVLLRNPCSEEASRYIHAKHLSLFFEVMSFSEEPRSWFIGQRIYSNGNVYMTNAFDPLFWGLYYIRLNCVDRCVPIDQAVIDENFENTHLILDVLTTEQLSMIADQKGDPSLKAFKYNEQKALKWLSLKCKKLSQELIARNFHIGAKSAYFVKSEKIDNQSQNINSEMLSYAFGIVSDYIKSDLSDKLAEHLGLEKVKPIASSKRKSSPGSEAKPIKRIKTEEDYHSNENSPVVNTPKEKKVSAKEKQMVRAASGTKSISSFFTKK